MRYAITGGTGLVGKHLTELLLKNGHDVTILTRSPDKHQDSRISFVEWLRDGSEPEKYLKDTDIFVNLAGESINSGRWTDERKERILYSRISATKEIVRIIGALEKKPAKLINASAIGIYKASETITHTETSRATSDDFLGITVKRWEDEASNVEEYGVDVAFTRFGIILDKDEGALPKMTLPYKLFGGGTVGSGRQWMSWVHIEDVARAIEFISRHQVKGPVNVVAPSPLQMKTFGKTIGKVLHRPHWMPVPGFALKLALGEMSTLMLDGQKVLPDVLLHTGYTFSHSTLEEALEDIY
ncbi:multidrug MFS transporter [Bacillus coahuilensis p1.1.43]|uniref:Multidrug MFS transporter n=1 Tax=Bacillus coahuilensis p1.1.43 TaxID=1150625 RepID=A0A147KBG6_9BACI|nr:TIGR01777 family oxidoreductase [Bacillus coahuilensis]KUP08501.1 multidrug MFS transporter [Bacillus coahuilensis p1.1.43]